jgi:hypothetical protein
MLHKKSPYQIMIVPQSIWCIPISAQEQSRIFNPPAGKHVLISFCPMARPIHTAQLKSVDRRR